MSDVRRWHEAIGLTQYADAFEANDIDMDLLSHVTTRYSRTSACPSAGIDCEFARR